MQRPLDSETSILFRQPLAPIRSMDARHSIDDLKLVFSSSYTSLSAARSYSDNDDERHSFYQRRKYSVPALTISRLPHGRRRSRNSPVISASHTLNRSYHGSQRRTSLPALHFHEAKVATLRLETPLPNGDAIPDDIYRQLKTYTFGSPDSQRVTHEDQYINEDDDEKIRDSRAKRRNTSSGLSKESLSTTPSIRPQSSLSSFSSEGIVIGELQTDNQSEPDWNTVMNDTASGRTSTRPSSSLDSASVRSEPRRSSIVSQPVLRRQSRSANELKSDIDQVDIAKTPTQTSFRSTSQQPLFDWSKNNASSNATGSSDQAYIGFDLPFIFNSQNRNPSAMPKSSSHAKGNVESTSFQPLSLDSPSMISLTGVVQSTPLKGQASSGNIFSRLKAKVKQTLPQHEDTFMKHIMDPEWTFRPMSQSEYHSRIRDHDSGHKLVDSPEGWSCQPIGEFIVFKMWMPNNSIPVPPPNVKPPHCNQLRIHRLMDSPSTGSTPLVIVHRHSQVQGFSLYRYASQATTDAILLAPKHVLRQYTRTRSTRSLKTHGLIEDVKPPLVPRQSSATDRHNSEGTNGPSAVIGGLDRPSAFTTNRPIYSDQQMLFSPEPSRPPTASSMGTDHSLSVITDSSKTLEYPRIISSSEYILSSEPSSPRSPRFSTSHAEAFAMIPDYIPAATSAHPQTLHGQKSTFGWLKAFSSKPSLHKDPREPSSPATDEEEELKKGDFVGPWVKIAPRADRVEAERQVKQVSESFECVGLIPPHEKRKKRRNNNNTTVEECAALEKISSDSMCMLLPLWSEQIETPLSSHASLSGKSIRSGQSSMSKPSVPLEDRKYLLVSYVPHEEEVSNKRRRSPGGNTSPHSNYTQAFHATGEILTYGDLRSSGLRLPQKGFCVNGTSAITISQEQKPHVLAVCPNRQDGVMIDHEALEAFGFVETSPEGARLSEMGKAVAEMVWCGCITLVTFMS